MHKHILILSPLLFFVVASTQASSAVDSLMKQYNSEGAIESATSVTQGEQLWIKKFNSNTGERSCASCHTSDLTATGKHIKTGKSIKPMAPSVNPERLTEVKKIEKWFKRNCKWTLGRECSAQEKASLLTYLNSK